MSAPAPAFDRITYERRFRKAGVPALTYDYSLREHVAPRVLPPLTAAAATVPFVLAGGRGFWTILVIWLGSTAAFQLLASWMPVRGTMVVICWAWPVAVPLLYAVLSPTALPDILPSGVKTPADPGYADLLLTAGLSALYLAAIWACVALLLLASVWVGAVSLAKHALADFFSHMPGIVRLQTKTLPAMVVLTLFLFLNADVWQAAEHLDAGRLSLALLLFAVVALFAGGARIREVRDNLSRVHGRLGTGGAGQALPALTAAQRFNVAMALTTRQLAGAVWVGVGVFLYFFTLGVIVLVPDTMKQWLGAGYETLSWSDDVPVALVHVAGLLAGFSAMAFTVASATDSAYRRDYFDPISDEIAQILSLHVTYASHLGVPRRNVWQVRFSSWVIERAGGVSPYYTALAVQTLSRTYDAGTSGLVVAQAASKVSASADGEPGSAV
ncbi:hypothetical protein [Paractinoplanes atraurantiacus]|uniref:Integral membrane protein n=1 Tax=Paractinoplanes atraurantiacus TaxID=1036182 RepID=A0A285J4F0_9ACTN|nr:hypothetical protein [Actinoplanes atraurantiacus]SNY55078.1 hypothetical protein SAMN05421748_11628 [Actinoplanes atraurantiacus]